MIIFNNICTYFLSCVKNVRALPTFSILLILNHPRPTAYNKSLKQTHVAQAPRQTRWLPDNYQPCKLTPLYVFGALDEISLKHLRLRIHHLQYIIRSINKLLISTTVTHTIHTYVIQLHTHTINRYIHAPTHYY